MSGTKHDDDKAPWHLLPFDAVGEIVAVLKFGAKKYSERDWEGGIVYSRLFAAAQRHMTAWWHGEDRDPETNLSHLAHAGCCTLFMLAFVVRGRDDLDNRPKVTPRVPQKSEPSTLAELAADIFNKHVLGAVIGQVLSPEAPPEADRIVATRELFTLGED